MRINRDSLDFMPDAVAATHRTAARMAYILTIVTALFFAGFLYWANFATLEEVTRGEGRIIPSSRVQVVQNLEGGILAEILVKEGQTVQQGTVLVRIDKTQARASFQETRSRYLSLLASIARLRAELTGSATIAFPAEIGRNAPQAAEDQRSLFAARRAQLDAELVVLRSQAAQRKQEIAELRSRQAQITKTLGIVREELDMTRPLVKTGVMSRVNLLRLEREISTLNGDREVARLSIPRVESALSEARERVRAKILAFRTNALEALNGQRAETQGLVETMKASKDRLIRTEVRSPVRGIVKDIKLNTIGGVIRPGQDILEIVPLGDTLLVEARIRPADIAFLGPDHSATVKITAYDYSIFGGLDAQIEQISADTIRDEQGEHFYRVLLRTKTGSLVHNGRDLPIIPGMTATVEILTGKKTVLDYLLKPLLKAKENALRER